MPTRKRRVAVVGAGPAGLAAAARLLESTGDELQVELFSQGHHLGGKAASWRDSQGYSIDHGFHAVFGFYEQLRGLAVRAGVDLQRALVSSRGRNRFLHQGRMLEFQAARNPLVMGSRLTALDGLEPGERRQLAEAAVRIAKTLERTPDREALDDVCFKAFLLQHGAPVGFLRHPLVRQVQELLFNHPYEISTYIVLRGMELMGHCYADAVHSYIAGGISELFWQPIARYVERLGGVIHRHHKLVGLRHQDSRLTGAVFATPNQPGYHSNGQSWPDTIPVLPGSQQEQRFDALICTLPAACFTELNPGDALWNDPFFSRIHQLTSVSTLSLQAWFSRAPESPLVGAVSGLPLPFGYVVEFKSLIPAERTNTQVGSALEWVGAESGFEQLSDEALAESALSGLRQIPGYQHFSADDVVHLSLRRNRSRHNRYLLTEPGTLRFRPTVRTPLRGLFLAGDWIRNEIDLPTMEGAVRSGQRAAELTLESL